MRIVQEKIDNENFLELSLTVKEFDYIKDFMIVSQIYDVYGNPTSIGVKLDFDEDSDDNCECFLESDEKFVF